MEHERTICIVRFLEYGIIQVNKEVVIEDTKIQWHPGFVAAMNLEFKDNLNELTFEKEYNLNTKPLEADLLIIKKNPATCSINFWLQICTAPSRRSLFPSLSNS